MVKIIFLVFLLVNLIRCNSSDENDQLVKNEKVLSRRKRYLVFPTGSSFSVATCMTIGVYGNPNYSLFRYISYLTD